MPKFRAQNEPPYAESAQSIRIFLLIQDMGNQKQQTVSDWRAFEMVLYERKVGNISKTAYKKLSNIGPAHFLELLLPLF